MGAKERPYHQRIVLVVGNDVADLCCCHATYRLEGLALQKVLHKQQTNE
jgi:hypothetical protein